MADAIHPPIFCYLCIPKKLLANEGTCTVEPSPTSLPLPVVFCMRFFFGTADFRKTRENKCLEMANSCLLYMYHCALRPHTYFFPLFIYLKESLFNKNGYLPKVELDFHLLFPLVFLFVRAYLQNGQLNRKESCIKFQQDRRYGWLLFSFSRESHKKSLANEPVRRDLSAVNLKC